jgi:tetraacyldisaccharide 4'-kinase
MQQAPPSDGSAGSLPPTHTWPQTWRSRFAARLQQSWVKRDWLSVALLEVSYAYRSLAALRRWLYACGVFKSVRLPVPVVIVGNVVVGGAGKTPVVIEIVRHLRGQGWQVGVVSRGYGREGISVLQVKADTPVAQSGDEPALIAQATEAPVFVAASRAEAGLALLVAYPDTQVIVCDDGLQHLALQRDIEICVFDERGLGNGSLLPAGPLREPWPRSSRGGEPSPRSSRGGEPWPRSSKGSEPWPRNPKGGRKVDFVLQTNAQRPANNNANQFNSFILQRSLATYALRADGSQVPLATLAGQPIHAVAAIAQPEAFFGMLRSQGLTLAETTALPDHYDFNSWLCNIPLGHSLICTQKDAKKLWPKHPDALAVPLVVDIPETFFQAFTHQLRALVSSPHGHQTT